MKKTVFILFLFFVGFISKGQVDTSGNSEISDSLAIPIPWVDNQFQLDSIYVKLLNNPYLQPIGQPVYLVIKEKVRVSKDDFFYLLVAMLFLLAFIRAIYPSYFKSIFQVLFQPSFRQKKTREQLLQTSIPALLLNFFFIISGGIYIVLVLEQFKIIIPNFWIGLSFSCLFLLILYVGKFIFLNFAGWVFQVKQTIDTYIYIVYLINKIIGVLLVPFIFLIAFSKAKIVGISVTISLLLIIFLIIYRYIASIGLVRRDVKLSTLHFFLYIIAIEIIPLLLIYKLLSIYLNITL